MCKACIEKQKQLIEQFSDCKTREQRYRRIIELGRNLPTLPDMHKTEENRVHGCQSRMFLHTTVSKGEIFFQGASDALISQGLAALLIYVYSGQAPETVLQCPPQFLEELDIPGSLSANRANGLYSLHLRMKQEALKSLMNLL